MRKAGKPCSVLAVSGSGHDSGLPAGLGKHPAGCSARDGTRGAPTWLSPGSTHRHCFLKQFCRGFWQPHCCWRSSKRVFLKRSDVTEKQLSRPSPSTRGGGYPVPGGLRFWDRWQSTAPITFSERSFHGTVPSHTQPPPRAGRAQPTPASSHSFRTLQLSHPDGGAAVGLPRKAESPPPSGPSRCGHRD